MKYFCLHLISFKFGVIFGGGLFMVGILVGSGSHYEAYAHITKRFGNVTLEVGWLNEPPIAGDLNSVTIQVQRGPQGKLQPVFNALGNVTSSIKYGTLTKNLDFVPSETADGLYEAKTIPTRSGSSYAVLLNGGIEGQNINAEIALDNVEGRQTYSFPDSGTSNTSSLGGSLETKLQGVLSQLSNTVQNMQGGLDQMGKDVQSTRTSIGSFQADLGKTYFIALSSVGVGLVGIIIAAFSLSRKIKIQ
jgi:hypothetical protein